MRKDRSFKTYGRHKNRVVVADNWLSDNDRKRRSVFGTSSELDSSKQSSVFHVSSSGSETGGMSINSSGNIADQSSLFGKACMKKQTRSTNKSKKIDAQCNKENVSTERPVRRTTRNKDSSNDMKNAMWSLTTNSDSSLVTEKACKSRPLRERNKNIEYNDSANIKKHMKGMTAKRKRAPKPNISTRPVSINYSDFDDYSLVISDSPPVANGKIVNKIKTVCIETSTPVAKRIRGKEAPLDRIKNSDLSHIEIVQSPTSDVSYMSIETPNSVNREVEEFSYTSRLTNSDMLCSPSIVSSNCSEDNYGSQNRLSKVNDKHTPENAVVRLQKLRDSFIAKMTDTGKQKTSNYRLRNSKNLESFDNSASLFSTPKQFSNISLLTERLRMVSFVASEESENDDRLVETSGIVEEDHVEPGEENQEEDTDSEEVDEDLSAVDEDEEESSCEEDDSNEEIESEEEEEEEQSGEVEVSTEINDSDSDECSCDSESENKRVTRNTSKKCTNSSENIEKNLQRLSESFITSYVSGRRGQTKKVKNRKSEKLDEALESSNIETSDSNSTLYMINSDYSATSELSKSDLADEDLVASDHNTDTSLTSNDRTTESSKSTDGDADDNSEGEQVTSEEEEEVDEEAVTQKTPKMKYRLRDRHLEELQNSFSEMLTPTKRKGSLVPISDHTKVLVLCDQTESVSFKTALPGKMLSECKKIGEGVYGEVFRSFHDNKSVAIKIIPIEGDFPVNDEPQKKFGDIIAEIVIAKELSNLRFTKSIRTSNFCLVNSISSVQGKYPAELLKQWDIFHKNKGSENDRPDMFTDSQQFLLFEFADCGTDLESFKFDSLRQAKSALAQVTFALAAAEEALQFEHRDLHWGNVLIRPTKQEDVCFMLLGNRLVVPSFGVEANIIDFTLSRLMKDGATVYTDLSTDDALFEGEGDYQFDIYRNMKKENGNDWARFNPHSNVLWLHYIASKLVYSKHYPSQSGRQDRDILRQFRQFLSEMLDYHSASEMAIGAIFLNS